MSTCQLKSKRNCIITVTMLVFDPCKFEWQCPRFLNSCHIFYQYTSKSFKFVKRIYIYRNKEFFFLIFFCENITTILMYIIFLFMHLYMNAHIYFQQPKIIYLMHCTLNRYCSAHKDQVETKNKLIDIHCWWGMCGKNGKQCRALPELWCTIPIFMKAHY